MQHTAHTNVLQMISCFLGQDQAHLRSTVTVYLTAEHLISSERFHVYTDGKAALLICDWRVILSV